MEDNATTLPRYYDFIESQANSTYHYGSQFAITSWTKHYPYVVVAAILVVVLTNIKAVEVHVLKRVTNRREGPCFKSLRESQILT